MHTHTNLDTRPRTMLIPVRCFTCGFPVGAFWEAYTSSVGRGENNDDTMERIGIHRYCCKRMLVTHTDVAAAIVNYPFRDASDTISQFSCTVHTERVVKCD